MRKPDFEHNTLRALRGEIPERPTLFELFLNETMYRNFAGHGPVGEGPVGRMRMVVDAMIAAGYEYACFHVPGFTFDSAQCEHRSTISLNDRAVITDWESFEKYNWPDPAKADYSVLEELDRYMPEGFKLMLAGPDGVLENTIKLVGYENLCLMLYDDPELVQAVFDQVGSRMLKYYEGAVSSPAVGFVCSNDDWGFNTQTFLSPENMRKYVFPWHKKIVELAHRNGKPCLLHSCGSFADVIGDVIDDMKFDCRHSYEDNICPVEEAYEMLHGRIAVAGGIDMNMLASGTPEEVYARSRAMLERTEGRGGYMLGSGNSVPEYVPLENFFAMTRAALEHDA